MYVHTKNVYRWQDRWLYWYHDTADRPMPLTAHDILSSTPSTLQDMDIFLLRGKLHAVLGGGFLQNKMNNSTLSKKNARAHRNAF